MSRNGPIVVTGAAGFIGSHVCESLIADGRDVIGLDNLDPFYSPELKRRTVREVESLAMHRPGSFTLIEGDLLDDGALAAAFTAAGPPAGIIHLAARAGVRPSLQDPGRYAQVNVEGTVRLLEAARTLPGPPIPMAIASSSSVYGNRSSVPFSETDPVAEPISPYAATKRACELIAHTYHHLYAMPIACLRFFTVFGPRQRPDLAIAKFIDRISNGRPITLYGDGDSSRDYTYIDDIVAGVRAALDRIESHGLRIWNLGGSSPTSLNDMVRTVEAAVGREAVIERAPAQPGDVERTYADLTRSRAELGFEPTTPLAEGVRRQVEAYRSAGSVAG